MTSEEATRIARAVADEERWPWREPIHARRSRRWILFGAWRWEVRSNAVARGMNVCVLIDEATGRVPEKSFLPR